MRVCLLVLEQDLKNRYQYIENNFADEKIILNLTNVTKTNYLVTLWDRYKNTKHLLAEYQRIKNRISTFEIILFSNSEGYIASNIISWIHRDFPNIIKVSLQHGFFIENKETVFKKFSNLIIKFISGFYLIGSGLYNPTINKYIVYNSYYKSNLVKLGVKNDDVIISSYYLKGETFYSSKNVYQNITRNNAIFLLQPLSELGLISKEFELELVMWVISKLSKKYGNVYIKQHPYKDIKFPNLPSNCIIVSQNLFELASKASIAFSFFSVALIELDYLGIQSVAIQHNKINTDKKIYDFFKFVASYNKGYDLRFVENTNLKVGNFYESEIHSCEHLYSCLRY